MTTNNISKLAFSSNESFPLTINDSTGELAIDFSKIKVGGINSINASDYPLIENMGMTKTYKTGLYRANSSTAGLPYDAKGIYSFIVFNIANQTNRKNEQSNEVAYNTMILIEDCIESTQLNNNPKMWIGFNFGYQLFSGGGSDWIKWSCIDSRGGCGRDLMESYSSNLITNFLNDKPTGFYWAEKSAENKPRESDSSSSFIVEKISHGDSGQIKYGDKNYVHVATYKATETILRSIDHLPTTAPTIWNGYVYLNTATKSKTICWFKA